MEKWTLKVPILGLLILLCCNSLLNSALLTEISYTLRSLGDQRWQYTYTIKNVGLLPPIQYLTIYLPYGSVNLTSETPAELLVCFDENLVDSPAYQPQGIPIDGYYDITTECSKICPYMQVTAFSVAFDWTGEDWFGRDDPWKQYYEIYDPYDPYVTVIESGYTVPEPATVLLIAAAGLALNRTRLRERNRHNRQ